VVINRENAEEVDGLSIAELGNIVPEEAGVTTVVTCGESKATGVESVQSTYGSAGDGPGVNARVAPGVWSDGCKARGEIRGGFTMRDPGLTGTRCKDDAEESGVGSLVCGHSEETCVEAKGKFCS
jgi:hypothetical protein